MNDTLKFFEQVLPAEGPYYLVTKRDDGVQLHFMFPTIETLARASLSRDKKGTEAIYFACASYRDDHVLKADPAKPGEFKKAWRVEENRLKLKSFFVDIDCGADKAALGKGYATKTDGVNALKLFCEQVGLPQPLVVDSGGGLHCYWPLTESVEHNAWSAVAKAVKSLALEHGFLADPSRTADSASILRTPGTFNRKYDKPKLVEVRRPCKPIAFESFRAILEAAGGKFDTADQIGALGAAPTFVAGCDDNALAKHKTVYPPSSARLVAAKCNQMAYVRDTQGDVEYPVWWASIGLIKHCTEGLELAQEWSAGGNGYSADETTAKYNSWEKTPPTCANFRASNPAGCVDCKQNNGDGTFKITSPISLGSTKANRADAKGVNAFNTILQLAAGGVQ